MKSLAFDWNIKNLICSGSFYFDKSDLPAFSFDLAINLRSYFSMGLSLLGATVSIYFGKP